MAVISVIIPMYKAEMYIERCVRSVLEQTFADFELLLVIDGSPDNSLSICQQLASEDRRITVIEQENRGAHAARLHGFQLSTAPYITFVDVDDWLPIDALQVLYGYILRGYDVVKGEYRSCVSWSEKDLTGQQYMEGTFLGDVNAFMWGTLYNRDLFDKKAFHICIDNDIRIGEDWVTNLYVARKIKKAFITPICVYHYEDNPESLTHTIFISDANGRKIANVVDSIIDKQNERWQYLSHLKAAAGLSDLFVPNRPYEHSIYVAFRSFVSKYGLSPILPYVDRRHLRFVGYEPLYRLYAWCYRTLKLYIKQRGKQGSFI